MGMIKRALRRTSRKLLSKIIPPTHSHQLVLNPQCNPDGELLSSSHHPDQAVMSKRKLASIQRRFKKSKGASSSKDTAVAEALLLAVKNYLPPIQFHHIHGPHAQLSANKCVARRTQSFCQALVFSNRVILPNERIYIKVLEIAKCWSGTIRFGFTAVDPATLACRMPKHACPDMTNAGHTWARALADEVVRRNSVIHFSYTKNGIIHYGINNQDCGIFHANVGTNQNLWFIVDIYGLTAAVELIDPRTNNASASLNNAHQLEQGVNFSHHAAQGGESQAAAAASPSSTMYKSTSAMDELFGSTGRGYTGRRIKKMSRKHARHAALIQAANWSLDASTYPGDANLVDLAYGHRAGATQLPNLNSVSLPSAQQNIYSPMPSQPAATMTTTTAAAAATMTRLRGEHDYHQIMSNTYSNGSVYQPARRPFGPLTGSVSMANIAQPSAAAAPTQVATSSSRRDVVDRSNSQADLSQQLGSMHLYERRMRKHAAAKAAVASHTNGQPAPVAATRKRQHLQPINTNQLDKSTASSSSSTVAHHRIVSAKSAPSSSLSPPSSSLSSSTATTNAKTPASGSVKPKTRHSIKSSKASTTSARDNNNGDNNNNQQGKDCPICFERQINCVLYQCGHMCTCYECGVKQWKTQSRTCPICRTVIKDVIKTYMS